MNDDQSQNDQPQEDPHAHELVHARYIGETTVVMPDLGGRERCCRPENHRAAENEGGPDPHATLELGDVILLDRASAEGREDFELVDGSGEPDGNQASASHADEQGLSDASDEDES